MQAPPNKALELSTADDFGNGSRSSIASHILLERLQLNAIR
jgi:hypothetical protein